MFRCIQMIHRRIALLILPAKEGVTQSRFSRDVSLGGMFNLKGTGDPDNALVARTRAAIGKGA